VLVAALIYFSLDVHGATTKRASPCPHVEVPAFAEAFRAVVSARRRGVFLREERVAREAYPENGSLSPEGDQGLAKN